MEITTKDFWDKYLGDIKLPQKIKKSFKNERVISQTIIDFIGKADYDKIAGSKILENHKLEIMDKYVEIIYSDYICGFEPSLFNIQDIKSSFVRFLFKIVSKIFCLLFGQCNSKLISSYFILILRKK